MGDPDLAQMMTNPKVMAAIAECTKNPMAIFQYQNDPEVGTAGWYCDVGAGLSAPTTSGCPSRRPIRCGFAEGGGWGGPGHLPGATCWGGRGCHLAARAWARAAWLVVGSERALGALPESPPAPILSPPSQVLRVFEKMSALFPQAAGAGALPTMPPGFGPPPTQQ